MNDKVVWLPEKGEICELAHNKEFYIHDGTCMFEKGTKIISGGVVNFGSEDLIAVQIINSVGIPSSVIDCIHPVFVKKIKV